MYLLVVVLSPVAVAFFLFTCGGPPPLHPAAERNNAGAAVRIKIYCST